MAGAPSLEPFLPQARGEGEAGLWEDPRGLWGQRPGFLGLGTPPGTSPPLTFLVCKRGSTGTRAEVGDGGTGKGVTGQAAAGENGVTRFSERGGVPESVASGCRPLSLVRKGRPEPGGGTGRQDCTLSLGNSRRASPGQCGKEEQAWGRGEAALSFQAGSRCSRGQAFCG